MSRNHIFAVSGRTPVIMFPVDFHICMEIVMFAVQRGRQIGAPFLQGIISGTDAKVRSSNDRSNRLNFEHVHPPWGRSGRGLPEMVDTCRSGLSPKIEDTHPDTPDEPIHCFRMNAIYLCVCGEKMALWASRSARDGPGANRSPLLGNRPKDGRLQ